MSSNSETGHAMNIANFKLFIDRCCALGDTYNPINTSLTITTMTTKWMTASTANSILNTAIAAAKGPLNQREILFAPLNRLVVRMVNMLHSTDASAHVKADVKRLADKICGFGMDRKSSKSVKEGGNFTGLSQQSYVQKAKHLEQLIELLKTVTDYKPNETELQITSLHALLADLKDANNGLGSLLAAAMTARNTRDNTLYLADRGIVDVVLKCKDYVKGLYGSKSAEYKMVSSLKFTRPKKTELINIAA